MRSASPRAAAWLTAALALSIAPRTGAHAAPPEEGDGFVSLPLAVEGEIPDHIRETVQEAIGRELGRAQLPMRASPADAEACADSACAGRTAAAAEAAFAARSQLTLTGPDYALTIDIVDTNGSVTASVSDVCDVCGRDELEAMTTDLAIKARRKLDAQKTLPPTLVLDTQPSGASVTLDGEPLGETPLDVQVPAGEHDLEVSLEGHVIHRQRLNFVEGVEERRQVVLEPVSIDPAAAGVTVPGRGLRIGGWTAVGVGVASIAGGAALFATDEREITSDCSGDDVDVDGDCRWRWNTTPGAIAATTIGGAAMITGAVLLGVGYAKKKRARGDDSARVSLKPRLGGLSIDF